MIFFRKIRLHVKKVYLSGHFPSFLVVLLSSKKKLIYYGFLGDRNFGDELAFMATKKLFKDCVIIPYRRHMPIFTKLYCRFCIGSINGIVIGGGTLIRKFNSDKIYFNKLVAMGKPVFFHGTGADEQLMDKVFWPYFLRGNFFGGLRGPQSQFALQKNGFNFKQIGDAALYLKGNTKHTTKHKLIIVNFGTHIPIKDLLFSRSQIIEFLNSKAVKGYKIVYLPLHSIDYHIGKRLKSEIKGLELLDIAVSYQSTLKLMSEAAFCLGERLHFIVMSVIANTNFVSINYDQKHVDFLKSLDLVNFGTYPLSTDAKNIEAIFEGRVKLINWITINTKIETFQKNHISEKKSFLFESHGKN